jgi:hypothetical protein
MEKETCQQCKRPVVRNYAGRAFHNSRHADAQGHQPVVRPVRVFKVETEYGPVTRYEVL